MKRMVKLAAVLLLISTMMFSCEGLNGDLEESINAHSKFIKLQNGTENGGDDIPDEASGGEDDGDLPPG